VLIRCVQGFSAGGEIGTITSFISEYAENGRRGFATSWLMVTAVVGLLIGGLVANSLIFMLGAEAMTAWGWRIPFLIAGPLGLIAIYIRLGTPQRRAYTYPCEVDNRSEVREFLMSRRAKITPEEAGLPAGHGTGTKEFRHPVVGDLTLAYEGLEMAAEPGSPSDERMRLLASWAATHAAMGVSVR
jgi:MFS family permease